MTTLHPSSSSASYIGFQILFGFGVGLGTQLPIVAVQSVLAVSDMPSGIAVICFFQVLGPSIFISIGQAVFNNRLVAGLEAYIPGFDDAAAIVDVGALNVTGLVNSTYSTATVHAYSDALDQTWYIVVAVAGLSAIGAVGMGWKRLEG